MSTEQEVISLRARVAELEERVEFLYRHLGVAYSTNPNQTDPRVIDALQQSNIIEAIKVYREIHGVGLAEAKQAVERIKAALLL